MPDSPHRRYKDAVRRGTASLDRGYELLRKGDEAGAEENAQQAISELRLAQILAGFALGSNADGSEVADEIERSKRLLEQVSTIPPAQHSPTSAILVFDDLLAAGDSAFRDGDYERARDSYVAAYAALFSLLPQTDATELPSPHDESEAVFTASNIPDDSCELCWVEAPSRSLKFRDESVSACRRCCDLVGDRFSTTDKLYDRCERVLADIEEIVDASSGLPWLSPIDSTDGPQGSDSELDSGSPVTPEHAHLLRDLVAVSQRVGRPATPADLREHGSQEPAAVREAFGSWQRALEESGLVVDEE